MNEKALLENKGISNDSGSLHLGQNYSPNLPVPQEGKKQENQSDSIEKILSSSIQRAKEKITMLEGRQQREERSANKADRASSKDNTNHAIAGAMKVLQSRVSELEKSV